MNLTHFYDNFQKVVSFGRSCYNKESSLQTQGKLTCLQGFIKRNNIQGDCHLIVLTLESQVKNYKTEINFVMFYFNFSAFLFDKLLTAHSKGLAKLLIVHILYHTKRREWVFRVIEAYIALTYIEVARGQFRSNEHCRFQKKRRLD